MKKYLYDYRDSIDEIIKNKKVTKDIIQNHLVRIKFFQHERLIHLLVTLFCILLFIIFIFLSSFYWECLIIAGILLIMDVLYIIHYYRLENGIEYLYKQYEKLINS